MGGLEGVGLENSGVGGAINKVGGKCSSWAGSLKCWVSGLGIRGGKWYLPALFLEKASKDPCSSSTYLEISK